MKNPFSITAKRIIKDIIPPFFLRYFMTLANVGIQLRGNYRSWGEAQKHSCGYDSDLILNMVKDALFKVKKGEAVYERDSVLFEKIQYSFPVLAALLRVAVANNGYLSILDFGGSLGSSYYQCRGFLSDLKKLRWSIVEQQNYVGCGKKLFEDDELKFYYTIDECLQCERPNAVLLSSVIQYIEEPYALIERLVECEFPYMIFDRTPFHPGKSDIITVQHVPKKIYLASYPFRIFSLTKFKKMFSDKYEIIADFDSNEFPALVKFSAKYSGFILRRSKL